MMTQHPTDTLDEIALWHRVINEATLRGNPSGPTTGMITASKPRKQETAVLFGRRVPIASGRA